MDTCIYCERKIVLTETGEWADMAATGDDIIWRYTCDKHDTFQGEHDAVMV
jgi:hypothetical protein